MAHLQSYKGVVLSWKNVCIHICEYLNCFSVNKYNQSLAYNNLKTMCKTTQSPL